MDFLRKLFGGGGMSSAREAKERLRLVLIHDRTDISPQLLENLRLDMIAVLTKYMDIDETKIEMDLDHGLEGNERSVALVANIPVLRVKRGIMETLENNADDNRASQRLEQRAELQRGNPKGRRHR